MRSPEGGLDEVAEFFITLRQLITDRRQFRLQPSRKRSQLLATFTSIRFGTFHDAAILPSQSKSNGAMSAAANGDDNVDERIAPRGDSFRAAIREIVSHPLFGRK